MGIDHTVKIPQKHIFAVLLTHDINSTAEKSSKNLFKMTNVLFVMSIKIYYAILKVKNNLRFML